MTTRRLLFLASLLAFAGVAVAEPPAEPLLAGPSANETTIPGEVRTLTGAARGRYAEQAIPHRVFLRAIGSLRGESASEEVRLSAEQAEKIRAFEEEYRASMQAFLETNRDEIRAIRARLGLRPELGRGEDAVRRGFEEMRRSLAQPRAQRPAGEMMNDEGMAIEAVREAMRALSEKAPRQQDAHAKVWALLTEAQRAAATRELERARAEQRESEMGGMIGRPIDVLNDPRVPEEMKQRIASMSPEERERALARLRERLANADAPRSAAGVRPIDVLNDPRVPEEMKQRIASMSPEERERALARLRERLANADAPQGPAGVRPIDVLNDPRVPESVKQRIANMSPEDRERALARLRERLAASEPPRRAADPGKPPPTVDSVDVPKPGDKPRR